MPDLPLPPAPTPGWTERWESLRSRLSPSLGRAPAAAAGLVAVVVVAALALVAWRGSPPPPELTLPRVGSPGAEPASPASAPEPAEAYVHVAGAVARPGLYRLPVAARVADVVDAAGGPTPEADVDQLNLAARVADGERLYVPRRGEAPPPVDAAGATAASGSPRRLDLNAATAGQLEGLPGVGPTTARAIVEHRQRNGRFRSVDDLLDVAGIGPAKLAQLRPLVQV